MLHTGDFRFSIPDMLEGKRESLLSQLAANRGNPQYLTIYLDTTYCDPAYRFPPQADVLANVRCTVRKELDRLHTGRPRTKNGLPYNRLLFVFGAYSIGKERVYLTVAKAFGWKIYADSPRRSILNILGEDWDPELRSMLTDDPHSTCLWVKDLSDISFAGLGRLRKLTTATTGLKSQSTYLASAGLAQGPPKTVNDLKYSSVHNSSLRIVGFRPTGWTFDASSEPATASSSSSSSSNLISTTATTTSTITATAKGSKSSAPTSSQSSISKTATLSSPSLTQVVDLTEDECGCIEFGAKSNSGDTKVPDSNVPDGDDKGSDNDSEGLDRSEFGLAYASRDQGLDTVYDVPYSEHSSFSELVQCLQTFRPHRVVPTVNTSPDKVQQQFEWLRGSGCDASNC